MYDSAVTQPYNILHGSRSVHTVSSSDLRKPVRQAGRQAGRQVAEFDQRQVINRSVRVRQITTRITFKEDIEAAANRVEG